MARTNAKAKAGKGRGELTLVGGAGPKLRRPRRHEWTRTKVEAFMGALAETCNVTLAAEAAGMSLTSAYAKRKKDAAFRASWAEAIASAYQRLEMALLERALNGTEKVVTRRDGSEERMREYSNTVALTLLRMHRDTANEVIEQPSEEDADEIRERLVQKLERLRERYEAENIR
ncbi:MAG: hypothetical protein ACLGHC_00405 [Alphaproteobacteria bacterium]